MPHAPYALCPLRYALCALRSAPSAPCLAPQAQRSPSPSLLRINSALLKRSAPPPLCPLSSALCHLLSVLCRLPFAPSAPCLAPRAQRSSSVALLPPLCPLPCASSAAILKPFVTQDKLSAPQTKCSLSPPSVFCLLFFWILDFDISPMPSALSAMSYQLSAKLALAL